MGLFQRRPSRYAVPPVPGNIATQQGAYLAIAPAVPAAPSQAGIGGTAGWKALPGLQNPNQQIGMYAGGLLNQFPAIIPGAQLYSGREYANSNWYTPTAAPVTNGGLSQTTNANNLPGGQLWGSQYGGPIGPISAQSMRANVVAQQVRQSGLAAMGWAKALAPTYNGGS